LCGANDLAPPIHDVFIARDGDIVDRRCKIDLVGPFLAKPKNFKGREVRTTGGGDFSSEIHVAEVSGHVTV